MCIRMICGSIILSLINGNRLFPSESILSPEGYIFGMVPFKDRSVLDETPEKFYTKDGDVLNYLPSNTDSSNYVKLPEVRAGHSMNLIGNPPYYILISGGFNVVTETSSGTSYIVRKNLDDLWSFSLFSNKWHQVYVNSQTNPTAREGNRMITVNLERLAIMFGGFQSDTIYDEAWYYNLFTNMWQKLEPEVDSSVSNSANPPPLTGHSLVSSDYGVILYGGRTWYSTNMSRIGTGGASATTERSTKYNLDVYIFPLLNCKNDCNGRGTCSFGRCTCSGQYYGSECQYVKCPNSLCFVDIDTVDPQECYHCSMHGTCLGNGTCQCDSGYTGDDCSIQENQN